MTVAVKQIGYPCVVKPVMSSSGKGQTVLKSAADIESAWQRATTGGRVAGERVIVEGWSISTSRSHCSPCVPSTRQPDD